MAFSPLPAVYIDTLALSHPTAVVLMNQDPAPLEDNVNAAALVSLDISVANGSSLNAAEVFINGTSVWSLAGGFVVGWDGVGSGTSAPDADTLRVTIDPADDFTSDALVTVRVTGDSAGLTSLDETYTFTIEDTTAPRVTSAEAYSLRTIQVTFDESMQQALVSASNDALNPANYTFAPQTLPAVTVVASTVEVVSTTVVVVTTDIDLSPGVQYSVTVLNAEDISGNVIEAPNNVALFTAFRPTPPAGRVWDLWQFLPRINREEDITGDLRRFVLVLQEVCDLHLIDIDAFPDILDPNIAPQPWLTAMLGDLGNPFAFELSDIDQRRLVDILVPLYKQKGTGIGIVNAIRFFIGVDVTCVPYLATSGSLGESELGFDFVLAPSSSWLRFAFAIDSPEDFTTTQLAQLVQIVNLMKPAHTHLGAVNQPTGPVVDHLSLGTSRLGVNWELH